MYEIKRRVERIIKSRYYMPINFDHAREVGNRYEYIVRDARVSPPSGPYKVIYVDKFVVVTDPDMAIRYLVNECRRIFSMGIPPKQRINKTILLCNIAKFI